MFASTLEAHQTLKNSLKKQTSANFFSHKLPTEKIKYLVIKGLPLLETDEIIESLKESEYEPINCVLMKQKPATMYKYPYYIVSYNSDINIREVRNIRYICSVKIRWDRYKSPRLTTQCHRCQNFGHGASECRLAPRCVKCPGNHLTKDCTKTPEAKPQCVNCKGEHPANYSKCSTYIKRIELIEKNKNKSNSNFDPQSSKEAPVATLQPAPIPKVNAWTERRKAANKNNNNNNINNKEDENLMNDFQQLKNELNKLNENFKLSEMITKIKKINEKLLSCTNKAEKLLVIFDVLNDGD